MDKREVCKSLIYFFHIATAGDIAAYLGAAFVAHIAAAGHAYIQFYTGIYIGIATA